jgi:hypothetical protein
MSDATPNPTPLERRRLLRTGVVMAGVAAGAVAATAGVGTKAEAATGGTLILGTANAADQTTAIATTAVDVNKATLGLSHANSGPTLFLDPEPAGWSGDLELGDIINTEEGPFIGTRINSTPTTDYLATGYDLAVQPILYSVPPARLLDTRSNRTNVVGASSATPFDDVFHLKAREWVDIAVEPADEDYFVEAGFFNLTATGSLAGGNLTAYPPGDRPLSSTLNFQKGLSIANGTFVALAVAGGSFALRIYTSATTHVILDYTGASVTQFPGPLAATGQQQGPTRRRRSSGPQLGRRTR